MNRKLIKKEAKDLLKEFTKYNISLWSITIVLTYISGILVDKLQSYTSSVPPAGLTISVLLFQICVFITSSSANYVSLDELRNGAPTGRPFSQQSEILKKSYLAGNIGISLLMGLYMFLWSALVFFPVGLLGFYLIMNAGSAGLIILVVLAILALAFIIAKSLSYMQALNIYKDSVDMGHKAGWNQAIRASKNLMAGYRWDFLIFNLSFFWWYLLAIITLNLASFYTTPYINLGRQNYYIHLLKYNVNFRDEEA